MAIESLLTPAQVAALIPGASCGTLANWRSKGIGPAWRKVSGAVGKPGGRVVYFESAIQAYLERLPGRSAG
jgi:hypothetical protein